MSNEVSCGRAIRLVVVCLIFLALLITLEPGTVLPYMTCVRIAMLFAVAALLTVRSCLTLMSLLIAYNKGYICRIVVIIVGIIVVSKMVI